MLRAVQPKGSEEGNLCDLNTGLVGMEVTHLSAELWSPYLTT
jgi:hypothetical protein